MTPKQIIAALVTALGLIGGTAGIMDRIYAKQVDLVREQERRIAQDEKIAVLEKQNEVYESIFRQRFALSYGPIAPEHQ